MIRIINDEDGYDIVVCDGSLFESFEGGIGDCGVGLRWGLLVSGLYWLVS